MESTVTILLIGFVIGNWVTLWAVYQAIHKLIKERKE